MGGAEGRWRAALRGRPGDAANRSRAERGEELLNLLGLREAIVVGQLKKVSA